MPDEPDSPQLSRRDLIAGASFIPVAALAAPAAAPPRTALSTDQRQLLEAVVDRLVPKDELGPGAVECGAANYIDLSLADALASEKPAFVQGLADLEAFSRRQRGAAFSQLSPEQKDAILTAMEQGSAEGFADARPFFNRVRRLTLEGMFCDPYYGGNKNFAGWDLIRYPGARLAVGPEDQRMSTPPRPLHQSAYGTHEGH